MDEAARDALFAEIVRRLLRMRIELAHVDFDELAGAMLLDLDVAEMEAAGRAKPRRTPPSSPTGTVVPFPDTRPGTGGAPPKPGLPPGR